jgi:hypothetical protein
METKTIAEQVTIENSGNLNLSFRILESAGLHAGDHLVAQSVAPGIIQLRRIEPGSVQNTAEIKQRLRQALIAAGYTNRDQVVKMLREIRREMVQR